MSSPFRIGFLLFPNITQLDLTGPYEVLSKLPNATVHLIWKTLEPVKAVGGLAILPDTTLADCPQLDLICVPGGPGMTPLMNDEDILAFLRKQAAGARYLTSVCTGSLVLGAAGLLQGKKAATHWMAMDILPSLGAIPVEARVVVDGNVITGGGVTAGIDFGLQVAAAVAGEDVAKMIQLQLEYDPEPPFKSGHPRSADPALVEKMKKLGEVMTNERRKNAALASSKLAAKT
ncbi:MAG TPA: DJ-1/PfpI family protein [Xanthobacteraceae bacterium]|nr:DJ-1/PfpI family protein [Xanthobacteraceae bacterium]